jgi:antitoxin YefM
MEAVSYSVARKNLSAMMDKVCQDCAPIIVTRKGEPAVVMLSLADYEALEETAYLLKSPANAKRLFEAIETLGQSTKRLIDDDSGNA